MPFRFEIHKPFGPPQTHPLSLPIVASNQVYFAAARDNIWVVPDADKKGISALSLSWDYDQTDMVLSQWRKYEQMDRTYMESVIALMTSERTGITEPAAKANRLLTDDELQRCWEIDQNITEIRKDRMWVEQDNALGDNATALYRSVSAPNVPWSIDSASNLIDANGAFVIHFHRMALPAGQARKRLAFRWSNYELEFTAEGPDAKLRMYNPALTAEQQSATLAAINALYDKKHLTAAEETQIQTIKAQIDEIKRYLKKYGRTLTTEQKKYQQQRMKTMKEQIQAIKDSKGLTAAEEMSLRDYQKLLWLYEQDAKLGLSTQTSTEENISITVVADPRGYVILHANPGNNTSVHEVKWALATKTYQTLWPACRFQAWSDGGAIILRLGYCQVALWGRLTSSRTRLLDVAGDLTYWADTYLPTGCNYSITYELDSTRQYLDWNLDMTSNRRQFPFIYSLAIETSGVYRLDDSETVNVIEGDKITEYSPSEQEHRRTANVSMMDTDGSLSFMSSRENYQIRVFDDGVQVMQGVIRNVRCEAVGRTGAKWSFDIADRWIIFDDDTMWNDPIGDNKTLSYYLGQLASNRGFRPTEMQILGLDIPLPKAPAGEKYLLNPKPGSRRGNWMRELINNHGIKTVARFSPEGVFQVGYPTELADSRWRFAQKSEMAGSSRQVAGSVQLKLDYGDFYNVFTVLGNRDPFTGIRYASRWIDWASVYTPGSFTYIGNWREYSPVEDESLVTQADVDRVCRRLWERYGKPVVYWEFKTFYDDSLRVGTWVYFDDKVVEVCSISNASRRTDRMVLSVKEVR